MNTVGIKQMFMHPTSKINDTLSKSKGLHTNSYRKWSPCNVTGKFSQLFIQCAMCTTRNALHWKGEKKVKVGLVI